MMAGLTSTSAGKREFPRFLAMGGFLFLVGLIIDNRLGVFVLPLSGIFLVFSIIQKEKPKLAARIILGLATAITLVMIFGPKPQPYANRVFHACAQQFEPGSAELSSCVIDVYEKARETELANKLRKAEADSR